jgi:DNA invertase Pin-like site-specific DNA recombinase
LLPEANDLTVGIMSLVAEAEREAISRRTKEALAVAKARGIKLGNPNGAGSLRRAGKGGAALRSTESYNANIFAKDLVLMIVGIHGAGHTSLRAIATELTLRGIRTRQAGMWGPSAVKNLIARLERMGLRRRASLPRSRYR